MNPDLLGTSYTAAWLEAQCREGRHFTAAQIHVRYEDESILDAAFGVMDDGSPVSPSTAFRTYCAGKPFLVAALDRAVERGSVDLDAAVGAYLPECGASLGGSTIRSLVEHQLPLGDPSGFAGALSPVEGKTRRALQQADAAIRSGGPPQYSEFLAWEVLASALGAATGKPWTHLVREVGRSAGGPSSEAAFEAQEFLRLVRSGGVAANVSIRGDRHLPLLGETSEAMWRRFEGPGFGIVTSARALAALVHDSFVDAGPDRMARPPGVVRHFGPARRALEFRCGLMAGPSTLCTSDLWPDDLIGHSGLAGMTLVAGSRSLGVTFAIHVNGMMPPDVSDGFVRPLLTTALHGDLVAAGVI